MLFCCQFASFMANATFDGVTETLERFTSVPPRPNYTSTTARMRAGSTDSSNDFYMWLPLIFVIVFSVIVIGLIIASRFSFRCCFCNSRQRGSSGESCDVACLLCLAVRLHSVQCMVSVSYTHLTLPTILRV